MGRYALHREIGAGGMATIHLGKLCGPVGFAPIVAIKSLHAHYTKDPEFVRMFLDEARLAGRIRHPNVVSVLDVFAAEGQLFLVLEYIHGESLGRLLADCVKAGASVPPAVASAIMCDVLHGLHAAHEARGPRGEPLDIVHRDVSPQNIIVGIDGVARVLDFGVAKAAGRMQTTQDGQVKGKFAYMSPEHLRGEQVNRQADIYSAAIVLWETLAGRRLFSTDSEGSTVQQALFAEVPPPSSVRRDVSPALDAVVMRGLARERSQRFSTAKEMALALEAAMASAPSPQVGEWVEVHAIDALEKRASLVAEVEMAAVETMPSEGDVERIVAGLPTRVAPIPAPPVVPEGSTAGQTVPDVSAHSLQSHPRPLVNGRVLIVAAAAIVSVAGVSFAFLRSPSVGGPAAAGSADVAPAASVAAAPVPTSSAPPPSPDPTPVASASARAATQRPSAPQRRWPAAARSAAAPSPAAGCKRLDAQGVITFDNDCLRAAQRRP